MGRFETRRDRPSRAARRPVMRPGKIPRMNIQHTPPRIFRPRPLALPRLNQRTVIRAFYEKHYFGAVKSGSRNFSESHMAEILRVVIPV